MMNCISQWTGVRDGNNKAFIEMKYIFTTAKSIRTNVTNFVLVFLIGTQLAN